MTIAVCCVTAEGIVLGADSTASTAGPDGFHYLNFNQKVFEMGERGTVGMVTWGLGGLSKSYRTLLALLSDDLQRNPPTGGLSEVAARWVDSVWPLYTADLAVEIQRCQQLNASQNRTADEEKEFTKLRFGLGVGFCLGGYVLPDRVPAAFWMQFDPLLGTKPAPVAQTEFLKWWGAPNPIMRLILGYDHGLKQEILKSGKWNGTPAELEATLASQHLRVPLLPIRDAVDLVHSCIYSTIKAMKFSDLPQICGGPIELAVITSDRCFRWVKHKPWDAAITES
jgi:hypothetical protein